jgi:hypothetical protein
MAGKAKIVGCCCGCCGHAACAQHPVRSFETACKCGSAVSDCQQLAICDSNPATMAKCLGADALVSSVGYVGVEREGSAERAAVLLCR